MKFKAICTLSIGLFLLFSLSMAQEIVKDKPLVIADQKADPPRILSVEGEVFLKGDQRAEKDLILEESDELYTKNGKAEIYINGNILKATENSHLFFSRLGEKPVVSLQQGKLELDVKNSIEIWAANRMFTPDKGKWEIRAAEAEMISQAAPVASTQVTEQAEEPETAKEEYRRPFSGLGFSNWGFPYWYDYWWYRWYHVWGPFYISFWSYPWYPYYAYTPWAYAWQNNYYSGRGYRNYYDGRTGIVSRRQLQDPNRRQFASNLSNATKTRQYYRSANSAISSTTRTALKAYPSRISSSLSRNASSNKSISRISPSNRSVNRSLSPTTSRISRSSSLSRSPNSLRSYAPTRTFSAQPKTFSAPSRSSSISTSSRASAPRSVSSQSRGGSIRRK